MIIGKEFLVTQEFYQQHLIPFNQMIELNDWLMKPKITYSYKGAVVKHSQNNLVKLS